MKALFRRPERSEGSQKPLALLLVLCLLPTLTGCAQLLPESREVEQLQIIQTVGVDYVPGGVGLTLAAAASPGAGGPSPALSGSGATFSAALERIRMTSAEEELFTGHVRTLLVGQEAAEHGVDDLLGTVCRSADLRLDMPFYIVRGGTARELMQGASSGSLGITEILQAAEVRQERRQGSRGSTADEIQRSLLRCGSALVAALSYGDAAESGGKTAVPAGLAVLEEGKLVAWIETDDCLGAELLRGSTGSRELSVLDLGGLPVSLELQQGECAVSPVWNADGGLRGLDIDARVRAAVLETAADSTEGLERYDDYLTGQLEAAVSERLGRILQLARQLELDVTGLGGRIEQADPERWRALEEPLGALLPSLEISITVRGELTHTYDAKEA